MRARYSDKNKINVITLGCSKNTYDSEVLMGQLKANNKNIHGLGFAFQRSTFLFWEKSTCMPVTPAISWQDSRATVILDKFKKYEEKVWEITGAPLSAHFGGPKYYHMVQNNRSLKKKAENGEVYFGPLSAFIVHALSLIHI